MAEIRPEPSPADTDMDTKLHSLFDAALEQQSEETRRFMDRWEELKSDQGLRLEASSFVVCQAVNVEDAVEITVTCESPRDLVMWKLCFTTATAKLNIPYTTIKTYSTKIYALLDPANVGGFLDFIDPLIHKTEIASKEFDSAIASPTVRTESENMERLHQLIDSVLEQQRIESEQLTSHCEHLKSDPTHRWEFACFDLSSQWRNDNAINLFVCTSSPDDLLLWKSCILSVLMKHKFLKTLIKTEEIRMLFKVTVEADALMSVLDCLEPLFEQRIIFHEATIGHLPSHIMHSISSFLETKQIRSLNLKSRDSENVQFKFWLDIVRNVNPTFVTYRRLGVFNEVQDFLLPLADIVESINIVEYFMRKQPEQLISISVLREISSRKCKFFWIYGNISTLSLADAEDLIEFLHHSEKKITVIMTTESVLIPAQIGDYKVSAEPHRLWQGRHTMTIKHVLDK